MLVFSADKLRKSSVRLFEKMNVPHDIAQVVSNNIVENCLYGHDSHGLALVPRFIRDIETGKIKPEAKTEVIKKSAGTAWLDGHRGFGQVTMTDAMQTAIKIAKDTGVSAVTITNCNHVGILWTFARMAVEKGMIGMIWSESGPGGGGGLVAPYGGRKKAIGANPVAIGIPAGKLRPVVLDMSTSVVAGGKVALCAQQNKKIPLGWLLDENGNPTTDPNKLFKDGDIRVLAGALLPMAGYKGFGLGLAAEILGGVLTGYGTANNPDYKEGNGSFIVAVDVSKFVPAKEFGKKVDALLKYVKAVPADSETKEILIPGELEYRTREQRERAGIPVTDAVWTDITAMAKKLKVRL